jgi:predicted transposase/invertase (TIGR01784 family)
MMTGGHIMPKQFYPPRFDYVFKRIFGEQKNIKILASFLSAALNLPEEDFESLTIVDPHLKREFDNDKESVLDVKARSGSAALVDVEIQVRISRDLRKRIVFTTAKMLVEQLKRGEEYQKIDGVVSIVICEGILLPEEPGYYNTYSIRNARSGLEFADVLQINILEPAKLPVEPDGVPLFKWGQFFKAKTPEELAMAAKTDPMIAEAAALVVELNEDEAERARAESRWRWQMAQAALRQDSYEDGLADGEKTAEAKYLPVLEENRAIKREIGEKDRENRELRRRLREAGIDP